MTYSQDFARKDASSGDIAEIFHENTKTDQVSPKFFRSTGQFESFSDETASMFVTHADHADRPLVSLPESSEPDGELADAILSRRSVREFEKDPITAEELSTLLKYGCGMVGQKMASLETTTYRSRGYPSAGGKYPIEPYVVVLDSDDIEPGLYYYSVQEHGLRVIDQPGRDELLELVDSLMSEWPADLDDVPMLFVMTGSFWKSKVKYGPRAYRFALLEAGHLAQNVQLIAAGMGLGTLNLGALDERGTDNALGINGVDESTVYGFLVGTPSNGGDEDAE